MKIKYNFGLLKNLKVGFLNNENKGFFDELKDVKLIKGKYRFIYPNNYIEVEEGIFPNFRIEHIDDVVWFIYDSNTMISGLYLFSMYDTFGFPLEITKEIMDEKGFKCDVDGFYTIKNIQKEKNQNSYKNKNAF